MHLPIRLTHEDDQTLDFRIQPLSTAVLPLSPLPCSSLLYTGLFLHVGYSLTERYLFETHSALRFRVDSVRSKLTVLLTEGSTMQVLSDSTVLSLVSFQTSILASK